MLHEPRGLNQNHEHIDEQIETNDMIHKIHGTQLQERVSFMAAELPQAH